MSVALCFGGLQEPLDFGGDFRLQMIFQHRALVCGEQLAALGDLLGEVRRQAIRPLRPVLVDDMGDQSLVALVRLYLVTERAQGTLQLGEVFARSAAARVPTRRRRP